MMYIRPVPSRPIIELVINNMLKTGLLFVWIEASMVIIPAKAPKTINSQSVRVIYNRKQLSQYRKTAPNPSEKIVNFFIEISFLKIDLDFNIIMDLFGYSVNVHSSIAGRSIEQRNYHRICRIIYAYCFP